MYKYKDFCILQQPSSSSYKNTWHRFKSLAFFLWPTNNISLQLRVIVSFALLFMGNIVNSLKPLYDKKIIDSVTDFPGQFRFVKNYFTIIFAFFLNIRSHIFFFFLIDSIYLLQMGISSDIRRNRCFSRDIAKLKIVFMESSRAIYRLQSRSRNIQVNI